MYAYMDAHMHICSHGCVSPYIHKYVNVNTHAYTLTCLAQHIHGDSCLIETDIYTKYIDTKNIHIYLHTKICTNINTDIRDCLSTYVHTYLHENMHVYSQTCLAAYTYIDT